MKGHLPPMFRSIFWETGLDKIDPQKHRRYIIERILQWGRPEHVRWMLRHYPKRLILEVSRTGRELSHRNRSFWQFYLTGRHHEPRRTRARHQSGIWQNR